MRQYIDLIESASSSDLDGITKFAASIGVELHVAANSEYIALDWIERTRGKPGSGARVMDALVAYADQEKLPIVLDPDGGSDDMEAYYSNWDFDDIDVDEVEDHYPDWPQMMIRYPQTSVIKEAKISDGFLTSVSFRELKALVTKQDMRGVAAFDEIFLVSAYDETHYGLRGHIGLPRQSGSLFDNPNEGVGFNFYCALTSLHHEWEGAEDDDGTLNGREDWITTPPNFDVDGVGVWIDCDRAEALKNRQFARMMGVKTAA